MPKPIVQAYYDSQSQREWERLARHRTEFGVTLLALADFLPPPAAAIADVGGGPGRYAIALTQQGYQVTLLDLAVKNLVLARQKAGEAGIELNATVQANALALPLPARGLFEAALLFGPLYHLLNEAERATAVAQCRAILQPGGVIFAAAITRFAPFRDAAARGNPDWIGTPSARDILETGQNPARADSSFPDSYFMRPEALRPFMERQGFETLAVVGCEGIVAGHEAHVNALTGAAWQQWVLLNYRLGREPSLWGASDHLLYVGRKPA